MKNFDEVQQGFMEEMAVQEAQRCLSCGCTCIQACPFGAMQFNPVACMALKCEPCYERLKKDEEPACSLTCPTQCILWGDMKKVSEDLEERFLCQ